MRHDDVLTRLVIPFHPVRSKKKAAAIKRHMEKHGWQGRELLVFEYGSEFQALTGSHRLHAAKDTLETVSVLIIQERDLTADQWEELLQVKDQESMVATMEMFVADGAKVKDALDLAELEYKEEWDF